MIIRNSCLASVDLNKCGTSRGGIRCKWGDNQTWSRNPQRHLWCSKWSRAPVSVCMCPHQINFSIQLFSTQWPGDQPCPSPYCLARQLWLSRTCNLDHGSKATCSTFSLASYENTIFQGRVVQPFQLCERRSQGGFSRNASLEHIWPPWTHGITWSYGRVPGWSSFLNGSKNNLDRDLC